MFLVVFVGGVHVTSMAPNHTIFWAPAHHSYKCENKNFFTLHEEKHEGPEVIHNLKLEMWDVHLQAYDDVTEDAFSTGKETTLTAIRYEELDDGVSITYRNDMSMNTHCS